jgi:hypothetical protein
VPQKAKILNKIYAKPDPTRFGPQVNIRGNRFDGDADLTSRIENSLKRIDDKFSKLNTNL